LKNGKMKIEVKGKRKKGYT